MSEKSALSSLLDVMFDVASRDIRPGELSNVGFVLDQVLGFMKSGARDKPMEGVLLRSLLAAIEAGWTFHIDSNAQKISAQKGEFKFVVTDSAIEGYRGDWKVATALRG
jgi:hypothetical protein